MRPLRTCTAALAALLALAGCDGASPFDDDAPGVVAPAAFSLDGSFPQSLRAEGTAPGVVGAHWLNAAGRVGIVTLAVGAHLVIPAAATDAATDEEPTVENGTWVWENDVDVDGNDLTFRLEGTPDGEEVDWRMLISAEEPIDGQTYDDFVLYTATTDLDGRTGAWRLYYLLDGTRTEVLDADFDVTSASVSEITFSVPASNPDAGARGESVRYARDGDARLFDYHQEPEDFRHLIEWSAASHAGSIDADDYNGGARACWDGNLNNTACTATVR